MNCSNIFSKHRIGIACQGTGETAGIPSCTILAGPASSPDSNHNRGATLREPSQLKYQSFVMFFTRYSFHSDKTDQSTKKLMEKDIVQFFFNLFVSYYLIFSLFFFHIFICRIMPPHLFKRNLRTLYIPANAKVKKMLPSPIMTFDLQHIN